MKTNLLMNDVSAVNVTACHLFYWKQPGIPRVKLPNWKHPLHLSVWRWRASRLVNAGQIQPGSCLFAHVNLINEAAGIEEVRNITKRPHLQGELCRKSILHTWNSGKISRARIKRDSHPTTINNHVFLLTNLFLSCNLLVSVSKRRI